MSAKARDDAVLQSYLDDGYCAQFDDFCSYIGWALFERYVVNDVVGANLSISYGGLTHNPIVKTAMILALEAIKPDDTCTAFYHCNTTSYTAGIERNYAILGVDVLHLMMAELRTRSGAAILPIPVTEALRIPTWQEVVDVHVIARRLADDAVVAIDMVDWPVIEALRDQLLEGGRRFRDNLLTGLAEFGIDMHDPLQLLLAVRRLGAVEIEHRFGVGQLDIGPFAEYQPLVPTDTLRDFIDQRRVVREDFSTRSLAADPEVQVVVASTDVHEYGLRLVSEALRALGIEPIVAGTNVDPDELADLAVEAGASAILVSTHNGMALTYAQQLLHELETRRLVAQVIFGGTLNQDFEGTDTPVDVRDQLRLLDIQVCDNVLEVVDALGSQIVIRT